MNILRNSIIAAALSLGFLSAGAATLFQDDFDAYTQANDIGDWTVEGAKTVGSTTYTWKSTSAISGKRSVAGGGAVFDGSDEFTVTLVSPVITLPAGKSYKVDFLWQLSTKATLQDDASDLLLQVRVPGGEWTTLFDAADPESCEAAGVVFPWGKSGNWEINNASVDISEFAGKQVQLGFSWVKKKFTSSSAYANVATIDDVVVEDYVPATGPVSTLSRSRYVFPTTWVGTISNSEIITLTNTGKGPLRISGFEGLDGTDFSCTLDPSKVEIAPNYSQDFNVRYTPTTSGGATTTMKILVEGGEGAELVLSATKKAAPEGYTPENFEDATFPPVGWTKTGNWNSLASSFSGDRCTYVNLTMTPAVHYLTTPRLDLNGDDNFVAFSYINQAAYYGDDMYGCESFVEVQLSTDGGATWKTVWSIDDYVDDVTMAQIELGSKLGNDCYLRWAYYVPDLDPTVTDYEYSNFFLDAVILPPLYGAGDAPAPTSAIFPADKATDMVNNGLILSWEPALFAQNYKVYLGTSAEAFSLLDGVVTEETSYKAPRLEYATTYFWKVVPANATGEAADVPVWSFTTMADQSIKNFPSSQDFEEADNALPLGWGTTATGSTRWSITKIGPFAGKQSAFASGTTSNTTATLTTPEIILPADEPMMVSFFWGNNAPAVLAVDQTGAARNTTTKFDGNDGCYLEIAEADGEWQQLALISEDSKYWVREAVSLADYAGKTVQLRWRYELEYGNGRRGICLDNVVLESLADATPAYFNVTEFDFGNVNANTVAHSRHYVTLTNGGLEPVKVVSVAYGDSRFSSDIVEGQELPANQAVTLDITFDAGESASAAEGLMLVTFEGGKSVSLPLKAVALPASTLYFDFEGDAHGSLQPRGLVTVDVDGQQVVMSSVITNYPNRGLPTAFIVLNVTPEYADWRNIYPVSGDQVLAAFRTANQYVKADDWIISPLMEATATSQFRFFGKSYGTTDEFNDFTHHRFEVYVSTTGRDVADFTDKVQPETELAYDKDGKFTEYTVDLGDYDGKEIYVALRHIGPINSYVAFFDDFYFENFGKFDLSGISVVEAVDAEAVYYDLNGLPVDFDSAAPGIYVKVSGGKAVKILK